MGVVDLASRDPHDLNSLPITLAEHFSPFWGLVTFWQAICGPCDFIQRATMTARTTCPECYGECKCIECDGRGKVYGNRFRDDKCKVCDGSGECPRCNAEGVVTETDRPA